VTRREFLAASAAAPLVLAAAGRLARAEEALKTQLKKAVICDRPAEDLLRKLKDAGFDGVETTAADPPPPPARAVNVRRSIRNLPAIARRAAAGPQSAIRNRNAPPDFPVDFPAPGVSDQPRSIRAL
jgi:hypothetical protein